MNGNNVRHAVGFVRSQGSLPRDSAGNVLDEEDLLVWFGLDKVLSRFEQMQVKKELAVMTEAEDFFERLRLSAP